MGLQLNGFRKPIGRGQTAGSVGGRLVLGRGIAALIRAATQGKRTVLRIDGRGVAVVPLRDLRRLERLLEQEEAKEKELDRLDVEEAERRAGDPDDPAIPYEQARRELGLADLPDRDQAVGE